MREKNIFLSTENTQEYLTIYIIPRKKIFYQQKILSNISLFILYLEKKL